jgi:hypothetical protein
MPYFIFSPIDQAETELPRIIHDVRSFLSIIEMAFPDTVIQEQEEGSRYDCYVHIGDDLLEITVVGTGQMVIIRSGNWSNIVSFALWVRSQIPEGIPIVMYDLPNPDINLALTSGSTFGNINSIFSDTE